MSNSIVQFQFGFNDVRVVLIGGEPWLVAKDVCEVLGIKNVSDALDRLDDEEKDTLNTNDIANNDSAVMSAVSGSFSNYPAQGTNLLVISESGFYRLVMTSRKPQVKKFQKWVTSEVIPTIRKTGSYSISSQPQRQLPPVRDIIEYIQAIDLIGLSDDPMIRSLLTQRLCEELTSSSTTKSLPAPEQPLNVTSIASNLGFSQQAIGNGSALGKYIAARHQPLGTSQHGKYQVNVYLPSEVESSIEEFFTPVAV